MNIAIFAVRCAITAAGLLFAYYAGYHHLLDWPR